MLIKSLTILVAIALAGVVALYALALYSRQGEAPGLVDGRLAPCPDSPNCVCSESHADTAHRVEPLAPADDAQWLQLQQAVQAPGGNLTEVRGDYLHAEFRSALFGFVDDFEARRDGEVIQLRSASRVGRSDLGVNRERVDAIRLLVKGGR